MACSKLGNEPLEDEFRIVLVGRTGAGKSATGNTILGDYKFESNPSTRPVTQRCEQGSTDRLGKILQVVDTPGFQNTNSTKENNDKNIAQCVTMLSPGIHAILFVIKIGRFTYDDVQSANTFINLFGPDSRMFVITVFTGADDLTETYDLKRIIEESDEFLKTFLKESNNRYISINNRASPEEKDTSVRELLKKIEEMQKDNGKSYFTSAMFEEVEVLFKILEDNFTLLEKENSDLKADGDKMKPHETRKKARHNLLSALGTTSESTHPGTAVGGFIETGGRLGCTVGKAVGATQVSLLMTVGCEIVGTVAGAGIGFIAERLFGIIEETVRKMHEQTAK